MRTLDMVMLDELGNGPVQEALTDEDLPVPAQELRLCGETTALAIVLSQPPALHLLPQDAVGNSDLA